MAKPPRRPRRRSRPSRCVLLPIAWSTARPALISLVSLSLPHDWMAQLAGGACSGATSADRLDRQAAIRISPYTRPSRLARLRLGVPRPRGDRTAQGRSNSQANRSPARGLYGPPVRILWIDTETAERVPEGAARRTAGPHESSGWKRISRRAEAVSRKMPSPTAARRAAPNAASSRCLGAPPARISRRGDLGVVRRGVASDDLPAVGVQRQRDDLGRPDVQAQHQRHG